MNTRKKSRTSTKTKRKSKTNKLNGGSGLHHYHEKKHKESRSLREARKQHAIAKRGFSIRRMDEKEQIKKQILEDENEEIMQEYDEILAEHGKKAANNFLIDTQLEQKSRKSLFNRAMLEALSERRKRLFNKSRRMNRRYAKKSESNESGTRKEHYHKEEILAAHKAAQNAYDEEIKKGEFEKLYDRVYVQGIPYYNKENAEVHQATMNEYKHLRLDEGNLEKESGLLNQLNDPSKKNGS